jgi:hypothetical protein
MEPTGTSKSCPSDQLVIHAPEDQEAAFLDPTTHLQVSPCRSGADLSDLRVRQGAQPTSVGHGAPVSVVVEVSENAKVLSVPLADAVGPPVQIGVAVRASIEVIMVRAVESDVNRCRSGSQDTGQAGATRPASRKQDP